PGHDRAAARDAARLPGGGGQTRAHRARAGGRVGRHRRPLDAGRGRLPPLPRRDHALPGARPRAPAGGVMLGISMRAPRLEALFRPTVAVARELTREVEVTGELVLRNLGRAAELTDLELVLIGGGTRRIDLAVPEAWRGRLQLAAGGELTAAVALKLPLAAPIRR